jgi:hypothetical protein
MAACRPVQLADADVGHLAVRLLLHAHLVRGRRELQLRDLRLLALAAVLDDLSGTLAHAAEFIINIIILLSSSIAMRHIVRTLY